MVFLANFRRLIILALVKPAFKPVSAAIFPWVLRWDRSRSRSALRRAAGVSVKIDAAWDANRKLYGARKIWHVLRRQGEDAARCTVERLMRHLGIRGPRHWA